MHVKFDYLPGKKKAVVISPYLQTIRLHFSEEDKAAGFVKRYYNRGSGEFSDRKYNITPSGVFDIGLTLEILSFLKSKNIPFNIEYTEAFKKAFPTPYYFKDSPLVPLRNPENFQQRDYQDESVKKALGVGNGIFHMTTAAGKTFIMCKLVQTIRFYEDVKVFIIVPTLQLVNQTYKDFVNYGVKISDITKWTGSDKRDPDAKITIANQAIIKDNLENIEFYNSIGLVIVDETHLLKRSSKICKIFKFFNTNHRYGFTGTLPESDVDRWNVIGLIGPVIYKVERSDMVDKGFIADVSVKIVTITYKDSPKYVSLKDVNYATVATKPSEQGELFSEEPTTTEDEYGEVGGEDEGPTTLSHNYYLENEFADNHPFKLNVIKSILSKLQKNSIIMVDRISQGETILKLLSDVKDKEVFFIRGDVEVEERERIRSLMEKQDNIICIAMSKIFSTGINISNIHYIVFLSTGKSRVKIIQSIGRGIRLHKRKDCLYLIDIVDNLRYGERHIQKRKLLYEGENFKISNTQIQEP